MNNTTKYLLIALLVVGIGATAFFLWPKKKDEEKNSNGSNGNLADDPNDLSTNNEVRPRIPGATTTISNSGVISASASASAGGGTGKTVLTGQVAGGALTLAGSGLSGLSSPAGFPLKQGSVNAYVKTIQTAANQSRAKGLINGAALVVDGNWGPKTTAAVKQIYPAASISWDLYKAIEGRTKLGQGLK